MSHRRGRVYESNSPSFEVENLDVLVVGTFGGGGVHQYVDELVERLSCAVETYDMQAPPDGSGALWVARAVAMGVAAMARFVTRAKPDVVHVHTSHAYSFYRAAWYVLFAKYVWRRPVVIHVHGSAFDEFIAEASPPVAALQRTVFAASDGIVVLSTYWRDVVSRRTERERVHVIPNAVDPASFSVGTNDEAHVVFVSNLYDRKGVRDLIEAVDALLSVGCWEFEVSIAGDGPLADEVAALAERHDSVTYHGYVSERRKRSLLEAGSIFALPTYAEGLPIAMLEGMAGGNAVVSTTVGAIPEVIDEDQGRLTSPGAVPELVAALAELVATPELRRKMGTRNRKAVEESYSWDVVLDEIASVYRSVCSNDGASGRGPIAE